MKFDKSQKLLDLKKKKALLLLFLVFISSINLVGLSLFINSPSNQRNIDDPSEVNKNVNQSEINYSNRNLPDFDVQILMVMTSYTGNKFGTISPEKWNKDVSFNQGINRTEETEYIVYITLEITSCDGNDLKIFLYSIGLLGFFSALEFGVIVGKKRYESQRDDEKDDVCCDSNSISIVEHETYILDAVQEYLGKNRIFEIDKIIPNIISKCAKSETNLNELGIREILSSFLGRNLIVEKSKLMRETLLENPNRNTIYKYIIENPGVHFMNLARNLELTNYLLRWHLDMLIKFNFIKNMKIGNFEIFYDIHISPDKAKFFHFISKEKCVKIINYFSENHDDCTKYHLAKTLGMHPNTISNYINQLDDFGLIYKKTSKSSTLYNIKGKFLE